MFNSLPRDMQLSILAYLQKQDLEKSVLVCKLWQHLILDAIQIRKNLYPNKVLDMAFLFKEQTNPCLINIVMVGDEGSGLTTLYERLTTGEFQQVDPKRKIDSKVIEFNHSNSITLLTIDSTSLARRKNSESLTQADLILLCVKMTSFKEFEDYIKTHPHLLQLRGFSETPILLVCTHADEAGNFKEQIDKQTVHELTDQTFRNQIIMLLKNKKQPQRQYFLAERLFLQRPQPVKVSPQITTLSANIVGYIQVSSKTGVGIVSLLTEIKNHAVMPAIRSSKEDKKEGKKQCRMM